MRWIKKQHRVKEPQVGEKREISRFALLPITCSDDVNVWLARYRVLQEWTRYRDVYDTGYEYGDSSWKVVWLTPDSPETASGACWRDVLTHGAKHRNSDWPL